MIALLISYTLFYRHANSKERRQILDELKTEENVKTHHTNLAINTNSYTSGV